MLRRNALVCLLCHPRDPDAFSARPREEVDTEREADPQETDAHEQGRDPDHRLQSEPPGVPNLASTKDIPIGREVRPDARPPGTVTPRRHSPA